MKSSAKRLLSLVIVLAMALSLMPMIAFAADTILYVKPNANWLEGNARFAAYFFGNGEAWADCTDADGDGVYEVIVPEGFPSIIFCRMNPNAAANNWNNKWNQTADLKVPTDSKICYVVAEGTWDKGNGQWVNYTPGGDIGPTEPTTASPIEYSVAGEAGLCGSGWTPEDINNMMTDEDSDGIYTITFTGIAAGTYQFKVTDGTWNNSWGGDGPEGNYQFTLVTAADVTINFNTADNSIEVVSDGLEEDDDTDITDSTGPVDAAYYVAGTVNGWNEKSEDYKMTGAEGIYTITFVVAAGDHQLKVTDGTWNNSWGGDGPEGNYAFTTSAEGEVTVTFDGANITVTGEFVVVKEKEPMVIDTMHIVGDAGLTGYEWDTAANQMDGAEGVYSITFTGVAAGTYNFKFAANGTWDLNWASGIEMPSGESQTAWFNSMGNSSVVVAEDDSTVTLTIDITNMDLITGEGAVTCAVIEASVAGVTVSGTATTGAEGDTTVELIAEGEVVASATASGKEGTYSIDNVPAGTYTLKVSKLNHVTREYTVTVAAEDLTQDVKIHMVGDIDGNGKVNTGDVAKLNAHLKGTNKLTDEYQILCANVNGGSLNMGDTAALYSHIKGTKTLY